ncbi:MAG: hypothetical protein E7Z75_03000 [Methanobrevibacter olleyae]|uniref:Uncharacterized protein n=1 Tax=Methanobrevibacter olleyae TaxID=294671 RepID=A0A8T3VUK5_METOL|nr:hypothetical protein [Methanobrevibacter olleyae]
MREDNFETKLIQKEEKRNTEEITATKEKKSNTEEITSTKEKKSNTEEITSTKEEKRKNEEMTEPEEEELTLANKIIVAIGYICSIAIPVVGLVYGIILLMVKNEPTIYRKHAPYIIIISIILCFIIALIEMIYYHII